MVPNLWPSVYIYIYIYIYILKKCIHSLSLEYRVDWCVVYDYQFVGDCVQVWYLTVYMHGIIFFDMCYPTIISFVVDIIDVVSFVWVIWSWILLIYNSHGIHFVIHIVFIANITFVFTFHPLCGSCFWLFWHTY